MKEGKSYGGYYRGNNTLFYLSVETSCLVGEHV